MTILPIVERELRVAARKRGTYWLRFFAALAVIGLGVCLLVTAPASIQSHRLGKILFGFQGSVAFGFCLLAGVFLTADCLSFEKREGTLGLLFLTDLTGFDVVLGKLVASSVQSTYAVLAIFPVLGLPLLVGGVTAGEFWRLNLALLTTLMVSLVVGMVASSLCRETRQTIVFSFATLALLAGVLPLLGWLERVFLNQPVVQEFWLLASPVGSLLGSFESTYRTSQGWIYWGSIQSLWALCAAGLAFTSLVLPRSWQEGQRATTAGRWWWWCRRLGDDRRPLASARRFGLADNPFLWLVRRDRLPRLLAWTAVGSLGLLWLCFFCGSFLNSGRIRQNSSFAVCLFVALAAHMVFKGIVAMEASRRFSEDRSSGALELLLVTPLSPRAIVQGQLVGLRKHFRKPMVALLLTNVALVWLIVWPNPLSMDRQDQGIFCGIFFGGALLLMLDVQSLSWTGMLAGLRARRHPRAVFAALGRVMLPPWLGLIVMFMMAVSSRAMRRETVTTLITLWFVFSAAYSVVLARMAQTQLLRNFRWLAAGSPQIVKALPPVLPFTRLHTRSLQSATGGRAGGPN